MSAARPHLCPKCHADDLERREFEYRTLGYSDFELACFMCGLSLWQRPGESVRQSYYRWLMDKLF